MQRLFAPVAAACVLAALCGDEERALAADPPALESMQCDRAGEPGRVRCSVETLASAGKSIEWAEVEIVSVPDFAIALRGRVGPLDAASKEPGRWRFALALASKRSGRGEVVARVRVVECTEDKRCVTREGRVATEVVVGSP
jgi:hypothetical protein